MWCIYITVEYYSAIKRKKLGCFSETWMDLEMVIQSDISQKENIKKYIWNQEKWCRWSYLQNRNRDMDLENKHMHSKEG